MLHVTCMLQISLLSRSWFQLFIHASFFAWICRTFSNCRLYFLDFKSRPHFFFLLIGLKIMGCLLVVILDGVIVLKNILLNSWCALAARFLSAYACSKLVGTMDNKPLNYSWNDKKPNFISSSSSKALSNITMDDSMWCEKFFIALVFVSMWQLILGGELK